MRSLAAGDHERRYGDLPEPVQRGVVPPGVELLVHRLQRLRVGERQRLLDQLVHEPALVRLRRVDPEVERLQERWGSGAWSIIQVNMRTAASK